MNIKNIISERIRMFIYTQFTTFFRNTNSKNYAKCGKNTDLYGPLNLDPQFVELEEYVRLQPNIRMISHGGKLIVKKYSAIGAGTVIIPGSHIPTVGLPQFLSQTHINDVATDIIVGEDCWIGSGSYLLSHAKIGRGCVVAAGSIVTKEIPPYAVVAGSPAKIIASRFSISQIIKHETILYPPEERINKETLEELFDLYFKDKRSLGTDDISEIDLERLKKTKQDYQMRTFDED